MKGPQTLLDEVQILPNRFSHKLRLTNKLSLILDWQETITHLYDYVLKG